MNKFFITTPIYYVNAKPHIGHAYTTVAADILARYYRSLGCEVFFLTGTDEHGEKVAAAALKAGLPPKVFVDEISALFKKSNKLLNIISDDFIRTTEERHQSQVYEFFEEIKPFIYKGKYEGLYCSACEKFLTARELIAGLCPDHQQPPKKVSEENYFFRVADFLPAVKKIIATGELQILPEARRQEVLKLAEALKDFSISRESVFWGLPFPWDKTQTIYVWVEALLNYFSAGRDYWPVDLHLMAKDILKFHALYLPALLLAAKKALPKKIFAHGYFTIEGQKMSKTVGNIIDPEDLVKEFGVDATRYLLFSQFPFGADGDIGLPKLRLQYNNDLANGLGNLVSRVRRLGVIPPALSLKPRENQALEDLKFYEVLGGCREKVRALDKFLDEKEPWKKQGQARLKIIKKAWQGIYELALEIQPFMPSTAEKILKGKIESALFPRQVKPNQ